MNCYDKTKVGKVIGWGGEHLVCEYGTTHVIKFSALYFFLGSKATAKAQKDDAFCRKFFGKYLLETEYATSENGKHIVQIQPKIVGHYLGKKDLEDRYLLDQFKEITEGCSLLVKTTGAEVDLVGRGGVLQRRLSNIFVTPDKQLFIIDATLMEASGFLKPLVFVIGALVTWRQNYLIRFFLS